MSYLEKTLYWFLKKRIFGGIKKLKQMQYLPFTIMVIFITAINTVLAVLYQLGFLISLEFIENMLILQLFLAFGLIASGFCVGKTNNKWLYFVISYCIIGFFAFLSLFFKWSYSQNLVQYSKLIFFILWVSISCVSFFFLTLYFFTSFPKKVMMLGAPKHHIFFGPVIKLVLYISLPLYLYMIFQSSLGSMIIGVIGFFTALTILILLKKAPNKAEEVPGIINFVTALGFFHILLFYHLIVSFSLTSDNVSSIIIDILLLLLVTLYIVQSVSRRVSDSPERIKDSYENPIRFQTRIYLTDRLRKLIGEKGVILVVMGIVLGYHMAYLDSIFITEFPLLSEFFTPNIKLSALYHRLYLLFSFMIIFIAIFIFYTSKRFKELMVDKFTINQVLKYIGFYFKKTDTGISPIEIGMQVIGEKVGEGIKTFGEKWKKSAKAKLEQRFKKPDEDSNI